MASWNLVNIGSGNDWTTMLTKHQWGLVPFNCRQFQRYLSYTLGREYWVMRNRYSRLLFTSEDRIWRHNAGISRSCDVTDQLWWRHNAKSEKTVLDVNCDMSNRWLFLEKLRVKDIKLRVWNKIIHSLPWITIFASLVMRFTDDFHSWKSLANRLTRDPKIVIHGNSCIILYILHVILKWLQSHLPGVNELTHWG